MEYIKFVSAFISNIICTIKVVNGTCSGAAWVILQFEDRVG